MCWVLARGLRGGKTVTVRLLLRGEALQLNVLDAGHVSKLEFWCFDALISLDWDGGRGTDVTDLNLLRRCRAGPETLLLYLPNIQHDLAAQTSTHRFWKPHVFQACGFHPETVRTFIFEHLTNVQASPLSKEDHQWTLLHEKFI